LAALVVTVNRRPFTLTCGEGEEARLNRLAEYVDGKIAEFVAAIGRVGEARLLLLAALVIADELAEARERLARAEGEAGEDALRAGRAAAGLEQLAGRIEALAAALERP
jgi:cell division protein ZapA